METTKYIVHWGQMMEARGIIKDWRRRKYEASYEIKNARARGDERAVDYYGEQYRIASKACEAVDRVLDAVGLLEAVNGAG